MKINLSPVQEARLWNLRQLIKGSGGTNAAAEILDRSPAQLTGVAGPSPMRAIGDKLAQHIEKCFNLEPGSLDKPPPVETKTADPFLAQISSTLALCSDSDKAFVLAMSEWIAERSAKSSVIGTPGSVSLAVEADQFSDSLNSSQKGTNKYAGMNKSGSNRKTRTLPTKGDVIPEE